MSGGVRQPGDVIGDYRLVRAVKEGEMTRTWEAEQISMQRSVMLEVLKAVAVADDGVVRAFLEDVRAKALVTHPGVGSVYEAVNNEQATFFSRERLEGQSLETVSQEGQKFTPLEVVILLAQIARAMTYLEEGEVCAVDYALHHFILVGKDQIRLMNLAVEGTRHAAVDTRAKALLGDFFDDVLQQGLPGATRVKSLCGFMCDLERPVPLTWQQIEDLCEQVRDQLEGKDGPALPVDSGTPNKPKKPLKVPASVWALVGGLVLIGGLIALMVNSRAPKKSQPVEVDAAPAKMIEIPAGTYSVEDENITIRKGFTISRAEITLSEYHAFLEDPDRAQFRHPDQPESKVDHRPDDWDKLWRAAVKGEEWQGRLMSLGCPVTGVDWWDAHAFAGWKGGRLPTLREWRVAATLNGSPKEVAGWGKVEPDSGDVSGAGVVGMAGNVREWTRQAEINPKNSLAPKSYVAAGASFLDPEGGIAKRLWMNSRDLRQRDLGFRIVSEK